MTDFGRMCNDFFKAIMAFPSRTNNPIPVLSRYDPAS